MSQVSAVKWRRVGSQSASVLSLLNPQKILMLSSDVKSAGSGVRPGNKPCSRCLQVGKALALQVVLRCLFSRLCRRVVSCHLVSLRSCPHSASGRVSSTATRLVTHVRIRDRGACPELLRECVCVCVCVFCLLSCSFACLLVCAYVASACVRAHREQAFPHHSLPSVEGKAS